MKNVIQVKSIFFIILSFLIYFIFIILLVNVNDTKNEEFINNVLNEFDKIFKNELTRFERNFNKKDNQLKRRNSYSYRNNSAEKNYYEWKPKPGYNIWAGTLRGGNDKNNDINIAKNSQKKERNFKGNFEEKNNDSKNIENQILMTKEKLKKSIKFYGSFLHSENSLYLNRSQSTKSIRGKNEGFNNINSNKFSNFNNDINNNERSLNNSSKKTANNTNAYANNFANDYNNNYKNIYNDNFNNNYDNNFNNNCDNNFIGSVSVKGFGKNKSDKDFNYMQSPNRNNREINMYLNRMIKEK
jgi:hypothetical protein